jgi:hypothetical protein
MALDIDRHFRRNDIKRYAMQCGLAGIVVLVLLFVLDAVTQTVLIAALASGFSRGNVEKGVRSLLSHKGK